MPEMIHKLAKTSGINIEEHNFHSCKEYFIQNLKSAFNFMDKLYFDLYVLDSLKERNKKYKLDFLEFISYDLKYAYCWAKKLKVSQENMPLFLQNCKHFESDANKFVQLMSKDISLFVEKDSVETCKFWGKTYELITVITPKCFDDFVEKYFIKQKPKIVGIDCEAHPYTSCITVLQLATPNWICLIDVQILFDKISQNIWKKFFQQLFHPSITRIGFSFQSDYIFMCKKFHFLSYLISEKERKVLCLQTLTNSILQDGCDISSIFGCKISADIGLSKLSKAVLNINLDKSLQKSDWTKRPLTQLQKIYAVSDALVVVLIKKEMEKRLQKTFGHSTAQKMINKGFITYKKFMKKPN
uniref:3'-5' exonuclease domain-containing protein n=1 Tax=Panagrolaimus davidi TaxID=227884 RepID=A0A914P6B6_9BILA